MRPVSAPPIVLRNSPLPAAVVAASAVTVIAESGMMPVGIVAAVIRARLRAIDGVRAVIGGARRIRIGVNASRERGGDKYAQHDQANDTHETASLTVCLNRFTGGCRLPCALLPKARSQYTAMFVEALAQERVAILGAMLAIAAGGHAALRQFIARFAAFAIAGVRAGV